MNEALQAFLFLKQSQVLFAHRLSYSRVSSNLSQRLFEQFSAG
ncbi:hypothetical protein D029_2488 [Vibrio parahaemolyticus 970107]|nr:hypothetical protein D029_2488 [Vibrio parahaemolyticus 970107]